MIVLKQYCHVHQRLLIRVPVDPMPHCRSQVLGGCIIDTLSTQSSKRIRLLPSKIPLDGSAAAIEALLKLLYSSADPQLINDLFQGDQHLFLEVMQLAHKCNSPRLITAMEDDLVQRTKKQTNPLWTDADLDQAVRWTCLAVQLDLKRLLPICETFLERNIFSVAKCGSIAHLPAKSLARILQNSMHFLELAGANYKYYNTYTRDC